MLFGMDQDPLVWEEDFSVHLEEGKAIGSYRGQRGTHGVEATIIHHANPAADKDNRRKRNTAARRTMKRLKSGWLAKARAIIIDWQAEAITNPVTIKRLKAVLREAHTEAWRLGRKASGTESHALTADDKRHVESILQQEGGFLANMIRTRSGRMDPSKRIEMYINSVDSTFHTSRLIHLPPNVLLHWVIFPGESCIDCVKLKQMSPFTQATLPTTPRAGDTRCLTNCKCRVIIKYVTQAQVDTVRRKQSSAQATRRKLRASRRRRR
jgi:hypothetical protein